VASVAKSGKLDILAVLPSGKPISIPKPIKHSFYGDKYLAD
jgi:hypothetical protein